MEFSVIEQQKVEHKCEVEEKLYMVSKPFKRKKNEKSNMHLFSSPLHWFL